MPLYEYECTQCHERTEKIQKFSDPEITICPHCSGHLERVLSAPAVSFKGGGWYADLYSSSKPKSGGGESKGTSAGSSSGSGNAAGNGSTAAAPATSSSSPAPATPSTSSSTTSSTK